MMKYLVFILIAILPGTNALALDENGNYAVWGVGTKSCFHFTKAFENNDYDDYSNYAEGFLTAFNITEPKTYNVSGQLSLEEILAWVADSCELKQMHSFEQTLLDFIGEHIESRQRRARTSVGR